MARLPWDSTPWLGRPRSEPHFGRLKAVRTGSFLSTCVMEALHVRASNPCSHSIVGLDVQSLVSAIPYIGENVTENIGQDAGSVSGFESSTACGTIALSWVNQYTTWCPISSARLTTCPPPPYPLYTMLTPFHCHINHTYMIT